jgi:hypothetical protein
MAVNNHFFSAVRRHATRKRREDGRLRKITPDMSDPDGVACYLGPWPVGRMRRHHRDSNVDFSLLHDMFLNRTQGQ